jgi:hypothetical protein
MKDEMLRQCTPSIRTISWFIFLGQFCLHTGIMNMLHFSPVRRKQNLARFKPVHISLTLFEHPSIRLWAKVPEFPFDRGKDVNALDWATLFQGYPSVKSPIVPSFTAVTPRLLLRNNHPHKTIGHTTKEANDKATSTSSLAHCSNRLFVLKDNNKNQHLHTWDGFGATDHHAHFDQDSPCANTHAPFDRGRQIQLVCYLHL